MMQDMYWRFLGALVLVVALIFALAWIAKRLGFGGHVAASRGKRRLSVEEVRSIDNKRRLVLVRRDGIEHLLLLGLNDDVVVETGIVPPPDTAAKPTPGFATFLPGSRS